MWDAATSAAVRKPLIGHTKAVRSVAYSLDGQYIISGSEDRTIRIWDASTGAAVGKPLVGHTLGVNSVAYSPDGQHIISGSYDTTIRIWDVKTGAAVGKPLKGHSGPVSTVAYSPDGQHIISASMDGTIRVWDSLPHISSGISSGTSLHRDLCVEPCPDGWVRDFEGGLLYWVPLGPRARMNSPALLTIPSTSHLQSFSLDFDVFAFGTLWTQIYNPQL
jgi:WD40 repeat protein